MNKKVDIKLVDPQDCLRTIFSPHLISLSYTVYEYFDEIQQAINKHIVTNDNAEAVFTLIDYEQCHDFDQYRIIADSNRGLPFPYLPTVLITTEEAREYFVKDIDCSFPTVCAILYTRDLNIVKQLYNFAVSTNVFDAETNTFISTLQLFVDDLTRIYKDNIYPHISAETRAEVKQHTPKLKRIPIGTKLYYTGSNSKSTFYINDSTPEIMMQGLISLGISKKEAAEITKYKFGYKSEFKPKVTKKLANIKVDGNVISNIKWK